MFLLQTVSPFDVVPVVVGAVSTSIIIVTVIVVVMCLLILAKFKLKKNPAGEGEDYTAVADTAFCSLVLFFFFAAPIDHVYWTRTQKKVQLRIKMCYIRIICVINVWH